MTNAIVLFNIAALRSNSGGSSEPAIWVRGYANPGDGGEGMFTYVPTDTTSADNGGTIIVDSSNNRYYREQHLGPFNILWFGGFTGGATDNASALNSALAALPATGGVIFFPPGKYLFDSEISYTYPSGSVPFSVSFLGSGQDASILFWPSTNGFSLSLSDPSHTVHFRDLALATESATAEYTAITIAQSSLTGAPLGSDFTNLTFLGYPLQGDGAWNYAINISGLSFVDYENLVVWGLGSKPNNFVDFLTAR